MQINIDKDKSNKFVNSLSSINKIYVNTNDSQPASTPRRRVNSNHNLLQTVPSVSFPQPNSDTLSKLKCLKERTVRLFDKYPPQFNKLKDAIK